ncbi:DUF2027 domain-containing protein [Bacteroidota bacterium]
MIKLGDKVRFVNENMEGFVTSLKGKGLIGVTVDSDFEIPVLESQVVKIGFDEKAGNNQPEVQVAEKPRKLSTQPLGVFMAFERINDQDIQAWIHNNFTEKILLAIYRKEQGVFKFIKQIQLDKEETELFGKYRMDDFQNWSTLYFQLIAIEFTTVKPVQPISREFSFNAKTFHASLKHCFFLSKQAYTFRIDESLALPQLEQLKQKDFSEPKQEPKMDLKARPEELIDLHYPALLAKGFQPAKDIVGLQMEVFTQCMEAAHVHHMKRIVFIHGIGNHYLRNKIQTWLGKHNELAKSFRDADPIQFGGGATEVFLTEN